MERTDRSTIFSYQGQNVDNFLNHASITYRATLIADDNNLVAYNMSLTGAGTPRYYNENIDYSDSSYFVGLVFLIKIGNNSNCLGKVINYDASGLPPNISVAVEISNISVVISIA